MQRDRVEIFINPQYKNLTSFIEELPSKFAHGGELIRCERNTVKYFNANGYTLNIKEFCKPPFVLNRIIYCYFRKPKAVRAYENAIKLNEAGFSSPRSIAYILCKRGGILLKSYFISEQHSFEESITDLELASLDPFTSDVLTEFGTFTAKLHNKGMLHCDYGNGNILINYRESKPNFTLIDTNRMKFGDISMVAGCKDFSRLYLTHEKVSIVAQSYAKMRGFDTMQVTQNIELFQAKHKQKKEQKLRLKRLLKL